MNQQEMLKELEVADELESTAVAKPEDLQALNDLRAEVADKRRADKAANIGREALVGLADGSIAPAEEVQREIAEAHDTSGPYNGGAHTSN